MYIYTENVNTVNSRKQSTYENYFQNTEFDWEVKRGIENSVRKAVHLPEFPFTESWLYMQRFAFCMD